MRASARLELTGCQNPSPMHQKVLLLREEASLMGGTPRSLAHFYRGLIVSLRVDFLHVNF